MTSLSGKQNRTPRSPRCGVLKWYSCKPSNHWNLSCVLGVRSSYTYIQILHVKWTLFFFLPRTLRSSGHGNVFGFSAVLQIWFFSAASGPTHLWKNATPVFKALSWGSIQNMITSLAWPLRFRHGLWWIWLNPGLNSKQTNWKSKVGHTWPSVSTWRLRPSFQAAWLRTKSIGI